MLENGFGFLQKLKFLFCDKIKPMFESESIELIKQNFNIFFDRMIRDLAEDDGINLVEFRYRQKVIEVMRDNMNETFDHLVHMILRRNLERSKGELGE